MNIPKRRKAPRMMPVKEDAPISCPGHSKFVRGFECALMGAEVTSPLGTVEYHECCGRMESHHVETRGAGGGDEQQVPLCAKAHALVHSGYRFKVDLALLASLLWKQSPHGQKWRREHE